MPYTVVDLPIFTDDYQAHPSYAMMHPSRWGRRYKGVLMCALCGRFGTTSPRLLANSCPGFRNKTGIKNMDRIRRGLYPKAGGGHQFVLD
eukprot:4236456-Pyramimonas_sp.AAC.4